MCIGMLYFNCLDIFIVFAGKEGKGLQKEIQDIKEYNRLVVADNRVIANKISQIKDDLNYFSEEEEDTEKRMCNHFNMLR